MFVFVTTWWPPVCAVHSPSGGLMRAFGSQLKVKWLSLSAEDV